MGIIINHIAKIITENIKINNGIMESYHDIYEYPNDPKQQIADFYAIYAMYNDLREKNTFQIDEEFELALKYAHKVILGEIRKDFINKLRKIIKMKLTYDTLSHASLEVNENGDSFDNQEDTGTYKILRKYHIITSDGKPNINYVNKINNIEDISTEIFKTNFRGIFGVNEPWYEISVYLKRLILAKSDNDIIQSIDIIVNHQHTSGNIFNRIEGYEDINDILNVKFSDHPKILYKYSSSIVKDMLRYFYRTKELDAREAFEHVKENGERNQEMESIIVKDPSVALNYAKEIVKGRWPEAEPTIMKDKEAAFWYATEIIKGRWPEAEPTIMKDPNLAYRYATGLIKDRWPKAEPTIMKDPFIAYSYTNYFIKNRWPKAEPTIMKDPLAAVGYAIDIINGRWPEAEPTIMKNPWAAVAYAKEIVKGRWPEAEPTIMKNKEAALDYQKILNKLNK